MKGLSKGRYDETFAGEDALYPSLGSTQELNNKTRPCLTERLLMGRRESNQTINKQVFL